MSITRRVLIWVGVASVLLAGVGASHAQIGYTAASLEWLVVDSDVVVRGTVVDVSRRETLGMDRITVTVDVHETLKGQPTKRRNLVVYAAPGTKTFEEMRDTGQESLLFLVRAERHPYKAEVRGEGVDVAKELELHEVTEWQWDQAIVRLGPPAAEKRLTLPIFTADLKLLTKPDEVLRVTRVEVAQGVKDVSVFPKMVCLPHDVMLRTGKVGDANVLLVPDDGRKGEAERPKPALKVDLALNHNIAEPPPEELGKFDPFIGEYQAEHEVEAEYGGSKWEETIEVKRALKGWYFEWTTTSKEPASKRDQQMRMMLTWDWRKHEYRAWRFQSGDNGLMEVEGDARFSDGELVLEFTWRTPDSLTTYLRERCRMVGRDELKIVHEFRTGDEYKRAGVTTGKRKPR